MSTSPLSFSRKVRSATWLEVEGREDGLVTWLQKLKAFLTSLFTMDLEAQVLYPTTL